MICLYPLGTPYTQFIPILYICISLHSAWWTCVLKNEQYVVNWKHSLSWLIAITFPDWYLTRSGNDGQVWSNLWCSNFIKMVSGRTDLNEEIEYKREGGCFVTTKKALFCFVLALGSFIGVIVLMYFYGPNRTGDQVS